MSIVADKLHLECCALAMDQHGGAYVAALQIIRGQIASESYGIQFVDRVHSLGSGWAVIKRGTSLLGSINHALRMCNTVPSGAASGPSIA